MSEKKSQSYMPIKSLYGNLNNFTIKARITSKSEIRTFPNKKGGQSKSFNVDLIDEEGKEIQAVFYEEAVDTHFDKLEVDKVYTFYGGYVQLSKNPKFTKNNDYILNFQKSSVITLQEDDNTIKKLSFNFKTIEKINEASTGDIIDVCGVILENSEVQNVNLKNGTQREKRTFQIYDKAQKKIEVSTWGEQANKEGFYAGSVVAIKNARVGEFREQKQLSTGQSSQIIFDDLTVPEIQELTEWKDQNGGSLDIQPLSEVVLPDKSQQQLEILTLKEIDAISQNLSLAEKSFKVTRCNIQFAKQDGKVYYPSCSDANCSKKVTKQEDGTYNCDKHGVQQQENINYRYLTSIQVVDSTQSLWLNLFDNQAKIIFGKSAKEIKELVEDQENIIEYRNLISDILHKEFVFTILSQVNEYQGKTNIKHSIAKIHQQDSTNIQEIQSLLKQINLYGDFSANKTNFQKK